MSLKQSEVLRKNNADFTDKEEECLKELNALIQDDTSLDAFKSFFDDHFLLLFIRGKNYNVKRAHETLLNYMHVRRVQYRDYFKSLLPSTTASLEQGIIRKLKHRDEQNRYVFVNRTWLWNPLQISIDDTTKMLLLLVDEALRLEGVSEHGFVIIFDMNRYSFEHAKVCTPNQVMTLVNLFWKNVPLKYKALHLVNEVTILNILLRTVKPFLPKKVRERLFLHASKLESLHKYVKPNILPVSLGGTIEEDLAFDDDFDQRIRDKEDYYKKFSELL